MFPTHPILNFFGIRPIFLEAAHHHFVPFPLRPAHLARCDSHPVTRRSVRNATENILDELEEISRIINESLQISSNSPLVPGKQLQATSHCRVVFQVLKDCSDDDLRSSLDIGQFCAAFSGCSSTHFASGLMTGTVHKPIQQTSRHIAVALCRVPNAWH